MDMEVKGKVLRIEGEHLNADTAMGWYLGMDALPPEEIAAKFMIGVNPEIPDIVKPGHVLVCGRNFGFGKVHSAFFTALRTVGIRCIVAESLATQMVQTALIFGVLLVECPDILKHVTMGDDIIVDVISAVIKNVTRNTEMTGKPFPPFLVDVMNAGGYFGYLAKKAADGAKVD